MRRYETITILVPELSEDDRKALSERIVTLLDSNDGFIVEVDDWGLRKLAYEIKKKPRGHYIRFDYCGTGATVKEFERLMGINDSFMKYMTVLLDDSIDADEIKAQLAEKEKEKEAQSQPAPEAGSEATQVPEAQADVPAAPETETEASSQTPDEETPATADDPQPATEKVEE